MGIGVIAVRMVVAAVFGGIIGFDREYLARPAGMRTHILVSLAAATFAVVTLEMMQHALNEGLESADPIRVIEAVTAGVAFLAAGTIIFSRGKVHGLTTGAGLWLAGAVGVACGVGYFFIALLATVLATFVLVVLRWVEAAIPQKKLPLDAREGDGPDDVKGGAD
ncbi:MAG: MgtC/SapB family protein [Rhizobiales bacterium]|nr:MgtC/SapB family protein [Hyphomicrobiales bacterium]